MVSTTIGETEAGIPPGERRIATVAAGREEGRLGRRFVRFGIGERTIRSRMIARVVIGDGLSGGAIGHRLSLKAPAGGAG
jgi:hypothetical protein